MDSMNEYINDVTSRIKNFLPTFIGNIGPDTYKELCAGFDNLSTVINSSDYNTITSIINCYIAMINKSYNNDSGSTMYLLPLPIYCKKNDGVYCEKYGTKLRTTLSRLLDTSDTSNINYELLPKFIKRIIFDLTQIDTTLSRYKIIIVFINMVIDAVNEYNSSSSSITRISNDKIMLYDNIESTKCPQDSSSECKKLYHNIIFILIILLILIIIVYCIYSR